MASPNPRRLAAAIATPAEREIDAELVRRESAALQHFSWTTPHEHVIKVVEVLELATCRPQLEHVPDLTVVNHPVIAIYAMELAMFSQRKFMLLRGGVVPLPMVRYILQGIFAGVGHLHRNAFVHRDLKPDNILMCVDTMGSGRLVPKIADLGSVQTAENARTRGVCTPHYRAPELFLEVA